MATNSTTYYNLPVFAATDQPKWLVDWNTSMNIIDGAIAQAKTAGDNAQTTADANALAITGLSESISTISTALGTLTTNVTTLTGNVQRINELIGNGTPTTQDKTIIGAINELKAAIDALAPGGAVQADEVEYDNTDSGLTATNVQDAIDELAQGGAGGGADLNFVTSATGTVTAVSGITYTASESSVKALLNTDKSIGKIYGGLRFDSGTLAMADGWNKVCTISTLSLPTIAESYNIEIGYGSANVTVGGNTRPTDLLQRLKFNTDGTVDLEVKGSSSSTLTTLWVNLVPCIYILKNLGD